MLSEIYTKTLWQIFNGNIDFTNDEFAAYLISYTEYTPDSDNDTDIGDISDSAILATANVTGKYMDGLNLYADSIVFESVDNIGVDGDAIVIYRKGTTVSDSFLYLIIDSSKSSTLPVTPDGTDIVVNWPVEGIVEITKA